MRNKMYLGIPKEIFVERVIDIWEGQFEIQFDRKFTIQDKLVSRSIADVIEMFDFSEELQSKKKKI